MDERNDKIVLLLLKETGLATTCIEQGLTALRKASLTTKWNYYQAFFLLSIGIERILKIIIISIKRVEENKLPSNEELKRFGHNIYDLFEKVSKETNFNISFLQKDPIYKKILLFISEFALASRYYNLDSITGVSKNDDPLIKWKAIQKEIELRHCQTGELSEHQKEFTSKLNEILFFNFTNEQDKAVTSAEDYLLETRNIDRIQGYSVFYFHKIISHLVQTLEHVSKKKYLLPYYSEFFLLFMNTMKKREIITRKNWNYLQTKR